MTHLSRYVTCYCTVILSPDHCHHSIKPIKAVLIFNIKFTTKPSIYSFCITLRHPERQLTRKYEYALGIQMCMMKQILLATPGIRTTNARTELRSENHALISLQMAVLYVLWVRMAKAGRVSVLKRAESPVMSSVHEILTFKCPVSTARLS
jgi:hypothetical protein